MGGTGQKARLAKHHLANIDRMKAIHILVRINGIEHLGLINVFRQGELDQDAVNCRVIVVFVNQGKQVLFTGIGRQGHLFGMNAKIMSGFVFGCDVGLGSRIVSNQHGDKTGNQIMFLFKPGNLGPQLFANRLCSFGSADYLCTHTYSLPCSYR